MKIVEGMKFGKLTTIERATSVNNRKAWKCLCECGAYKIVRSDSLVGGKTKSCGCLYKTSEFSQKSRKNNFVDLSGKTFGKWQVLHEVSKSKTSQIRYLCRCECGTEAIVHAGNLKNGTSTSCGCYKHSKEYGIKISNSNIENLTGMRFGSWTVIERDHNSIGKTVRWICLCDCGNKKSVIGSSLLDGTSLSCGCSRIHDLRNQQFGKWIAFEPSFRIRQDGRRCSVYLCKCECGTKRFVDASRLLNGTSKSCGCVLSQGEEEISKILSDYNVDYVSQHTFEDLLSPNGYPLKFDFAIFQNDTLQCVIEFQGIQHYIQTNNFGKFQREYSDPIKRSYCKQKNIRLFEIKYTDNIQEALEIILNTLQANPVPSSEQSEKV